MGASAKFHLSSNAILRPPFIALQRKTIIDTHGVLSWILNINIPTIMVRIPHQQAIVAEASPEEEIDSVRRVLRVPALQPSPASSSISTHSSVHPSSASSGV